jgi:hypothetical protein
MDDKAAGEAQILSRYDDTSWCFGLSVSCACCLRASDLHAWRLRQHSDTSAKKGFASR